jgi:3D (Asp-Asp-Asp) domain-containing protein
LFDFLKDYVVIESLPDKTNPMKHTLIAVLLIALGFTSYSQTAQADFSIVAPDSLASLTKLELYATQYFVHKFTSQGKIPILDKDGNSMGLYADTCNFCEAALVGTAYITDSAGTIHTVNFAKTGTKVLVDCRKCKKYAKSTLAVESWGKTLWMKSRGFGNGVGNYKLVPFRTIAVDKSKIPYGTVIYIPKAKGKTITLPNGEKVTHDGYFFAGDTGGGIKKNHIDVFTGVDKSNPFAEVIKSDPAKTFEAYIIKDTATVSALTKVHKK